MKKVTVSRLLLPLVLLWVLGISHRASALEGSLPVIDHLEIHGFISQGYMVGSGHNFFADTTDGSFEFNEMGLNFITRIPDYRLRLGIQLFARDLGQIGNDEILLDWAVAEYHWRDWLGLTAGKIKVPHGLYNETRDGDMLRTHIFLPQSVYNETWRDVIAANKGFGIYGNIPLMQAGYLTYRGQVGTVQIDRDSGAASHFNDQMPGGYPAKVQKIHVEKGNVASLQWLPPIDNLRFGYSFWFLSFDADMDTSALPLDSDFTLDANSYTLSAEYSWENWIFAAEYCRVNWKILPTNPQLLTLGDEFVPKFYSQGYYAGVAYRISDLFELGSYYSEYYPNDYDKDGHAQTYFHRAWLKDACLTVRFDLNPNWLFKIEGHMMNGTAILLNADNPQGYGANPHWFLFAAKATFHF